MIFRVWRDPEVPPPGGGEGGGPPTLKKCMFKKPFALLFTSPGGGTPEKFPHLLLVCIFFLVPSDPKDNSLARKNKSNRIDEQILRSR